MANWEAKARDYINQRQLDNETSIIAAQKKYYDGTVAGFKMLDDLGVEQTLTEIRDQVWGSGEIIKIPSSLENLKKIFEESKTLWGTDYPTAQPQYILTTSSIDYFRGTSFESNGEFGGSIEVDSYGPKTHTLAIYLFENIIGIYKADNNEHVINARFSQLWNKNSCHKIDISIYSQEYVKKELENILLIDCSQRRNYTTQVDPEILKRKDLYRSYRESLNQ